MTKSNNIDPTGQFARAAALKAAMAVADAKIAAYKGDNAGLHDLKLFQADCQMHIAAGPST